MKTKVSMITLYQQKLYDLDKDYQKQLQSLQKAIDKFHKELETLTQKGEKHLQNEEKEYQKKLSNIQATFNQKHKDALQKHEEIIETINQKMNQTTTRHDDQFKALNETHEQNKLLIINKIDGIEQEKDLQTKEIEKEFLGETKTLKATLNRFNKTYESLLTPIEKKYQTLYQSTKKLPQLFNQISKKLLDELNQDFSALNEAHLTIAEQALDENETLNKQHLSIIDKAIENIELIKTKNAEALNRLKTTLTDPFKNFQPPLNETATMIKDYEQTLLEAIKIDTNNTLKSINKALDEKPDKKTESDLYKRKALIELKDQTLNKHTKQVKKMVDKVIQTIDSETHIIKEVISDNIIDFKTLINTKFDGIIKTLTQLKIHPFNADALSDALNHTEIKTTVIALLESLKAPLATFQKNLSESLSHTMDEMHPLYQTLDKIQKDNDTFETRLSLEKQDSKAQTLKDTARLKQDIEQLKHFYDLNLEKINYTYQTQQRESLKTIDLLKLTEQLQTAQADKKRTEADCDIYHQSALVDANYTFKHSLIQEEQSLLKTKENVDIALLQAKQSLEIKEIEKEYAITIAEADLASSQTSEALSIKREELIQQKNRLTEQKNLKIAEHESTRFSKETEAIKTLKQKRHALMQNLTEHQNKLEQTYTHIERTYEQEIFTPKQNIKTIEIMIETRLKKINHNYQLMIERFNEQKEALGTQNTALKPLLIILSSPFMRHLENALYEDLTLLKDSLTFRHQYQLKQKENDGYSKRKLEKLKLTNQQELTEKETRYQSTITAIKALIDDAKKALKNKNKMQRSDIKNVIDDTHKQLLTLYKTSVKTTINEIKNAFKPLKENDEQYIAQAYQSKELSKDTHLKQFNERTSAIQTELSSLKETLDNHDQAAIQTIEATLNEVSAPIDQSLNETQKEIENIEQALKQEQTRLQQEKENINIVHQQTLDTLYQRHDKAKESIGNDYALAHDKLSKRMEEAKDTLSKNKNNIALKEENKEQSYQDQIEQAHFNFKRDKHQADQALSQAEKTRTDKTIEEDRQFKKQLEALEYRVLSEENSLKSKLYAIDSQFSELINEAKIKRKTIIHRIETLEKDFYQQIHDHLNTFEQSLKQVIQAQTIKALNTSYKTVLKNQSDKHETFIDQFITTTKTSIRNSTK